MLRLNDVVTKGHILGKRAARRKRHTPRQAWHLLSFDEKWQTLHYLMGAGWATAFFLITPRALAEALDRTVTGTFIVYAVAGTVLALWGLWGHSVKLEIPGVLMLLSAPLTYAGIQTWLAFQGEWNNRVHLIFLALWVAGYVTKRLVIVIRGAVLLARGRL